MAAESFDADVKHKVKSRGEKVDHSKHRAAQ